jgi:hypothetical protein
VWSAADNPTPDKLHTTHDAITSCHFSADDRLLAVGTQARGHLFALVDCTCEVWQQLKCCVHLPCRCCLILELLRPRQTSCLCECIINLLFDLCQQHGQLFVRGGLRWRVWTYNLYPLLAVLADPLHMRHTHTFSLWDCCYREKISWPNCG